MLRTAVLCLSLLAAPCAAQDAPPTGATEGTQLPRIGDMVTRFEWGVYCAQDPVRLDDAPDTAAGTINMVPDLPQFTFVQTIVPAELGIAFGVLAAIAPEAGIDAVEVTVTHPPYPDSGVTVERWVNIVENEAMSLFGFSFEQPSELVLGTWTMMAEAAGEEVFHIRFEVVPPDLARPVIAACQTGFMS